MKDIRKLEAFAVIIRATWERGRVQEQALAELKSRGLWLTEDQRRQAGLPPWFNPEPITMPVVFRKDRGKCPEITAVFPKCPRCGVDQTSAESLSNTWASRKRVTDRA